MSLEVANTIKNQLLHYDRQLLMCHGANSFKGSDYNDEEKHNGYLEYKVQNLRDFARGIVRIELNYKDLYTIKIYKGYNYNNLFSTTEDIYEDMLTSTLENILGT